MILSRRSRSKFRQKKTTYPSSIDINRRLTLTRLHLHFLCVAERPSPARSGLWRAGASAEPPCRGICRRVRVRSRRAKAQARQPLGQHPETRRHAFGAYSSAQRRFRHRLCRGAARCRIAQAGGSATAADDGGSAPTRGGARRPAQLRLCRPRGRNDPAVGELASPRSLARHGQGRPDQHQLQLPLEQRARIRNRARCSIFASFVAENRFPLFSTMLSSKRRLALPLVFARRNGYRRPHHRASYRAQPGIRIRWVSAVVSWACPMSASRRCSTH